ncbi:hypothetical protein HNR44_000110 [Geomicrobium halophilum]|uniref:Uncharacterized protein n=1 Tax=Geomicrobium halophilum TaxID=549000 RepID=A0A841PPF3_9BACL|nr:hypothetical protein [Geomicrobium halophilum]MBB6448161.1 hypothetical protein [Geomicrobium halophilum]
MKDDFKPKNGAKANNEGVDVTHDQVMRSYQIASDEQKIAEQNKEEKKD